MAEMMNVNEVAKYLGVSKAMVYAEIKAGRMAYYRPNPSGKIWISKDDIEAYLKSGRVEVTNNTL